MTKAVAIALNPIMMVDLLSGAAIDLILILSLAKLYDIPMTQTGALQLLQKIALSLGGISASQLLANSPTAQLGDQKDRKPSLLVFCPPSTKLLS